MKRLVHFAILSIFASPFIVTSFLIVNNKPAPFKISRLEQVSDDTKENLANLPTTTTKAAEQTNHGVERFVQELLVTTSRNNVTQLSTQPVSKKRKNQGSFNLATALFCGGLAFDAYVEPPQNSSRWEKGSRGMKVAFLSNAYTRQLYKGLVEITVEKCTGLPEEENAAERIISGSGVDACLLVAAVEGSWQEDVQLLEKEQYHEGVLDLSGAAHVVRSSTAWANVDEKASQLNKNRTGKALPYHIKGGWGRGGQAVWPEPDPIYLYVQDPATVRLVFTLMDDDRIGSGKPIGSTYKCLADLIPQARLTHQQFMAELKGEVLRQVQEGNLDLLEDNTKIQLGAKSWQGELLLTSKPRKRNKNSQIITGAAAGAYLGGPVGAAAGALLGSFYEGQVQGKIQAKLRYLPFPQVEVKRNRYQVLGGIPGINWGELYDKFKRRIANKGSELEAIDANDLEHCFFISHETTGATCAVYRSLEEKLIVVSFRGTCAPVDLITDASIVQEAWVNGEDINEQLNAKVHAGFRNSMNSISRRLKELLLATVASGDKFSDYDLLVTGHSLGGSLATLFVADIGQYGVDAGRGLPQLEASEPWWKGIADTLMGQEAKDSTGTKEPPRPKSLRLYNFGSPRVGNHAFAELFDALLEEGYIDQAYRIVNGEDVVARLPRSVNALVFGQVDYDHCGATVLVSQPSNTSTPNPLPLLWIEGESDDNNCPVRDGVALTSPMAEGSLLADLYNATQESLGKDSPFSWEKLSMAASKLSERIKSISAQDIATVLGIDRSYTERELKIVQSVFSGKALAHHMEDEYYAAMGRSAGFLARIGEEITEYEA